jgi:glutamine synthetase
MPVGRNAQIAETLKRLQESNVGFVLAQFVDINGAPKAKMVPVSEFENLARNGVGFAGFAVSTEMGQSPHQPDLVTIPDLSTMAVLPWKKNTAWFAANILVEGKQWPYCPRTILQNYLQKVGDERGLTFKVGIEPEFYLLRKEGQSIQVFDEPEATTKPCYDLKLLSKRMEFLQTLSDYLDELGWHGEAADHEDGPSQFEINLRYNEALKTCDRHTFFKFAVSYLASQIGAIASFMPKPFTNKPGNGAHLHMSLWKEGRNLFPDKGDPQGLGISETGYHFIGGLLKHARAYVALSAPTVNSYKRLVAGGSTTGTTWAPVYVTYGGNNRTQMIRVSSGDHLEDRTADAAFNPYLALTAILAAGLDGIENRIDPGPMNRDNMYKVTEDDLRRRGIELLPSNLYEAVTELEKDRVIADALGNEFTEYYVRMKKREWSEYHSVVSQWETDRYLTYP